MLKIIIISILLASCSDESHIKTTKAVSVSDIDACSRMTINELNLAYQTEQESYYTCKDIVTAKYEASNTVEMERKLISEIAVKATKKYLKEKEETDKLTNKALKILRRDKKVIFEYTIENYVSGQYQPMQTIESYIIVNYDEKKKKFCRKEEIEIICDVDIKDGYLIKEGE